MKKALLILALATLYSCNCKKNTVQNTKEKQSSITSACPEDGKCTVSILKNKSLKFTSDKFGTGYYTLDENVATSVIQYQYNRNVPEGLQDGNHKEEILFEINNNDTSLDLTDSDLQKTKMIFGRICFCRGQTGYYKVTSGTLNLKKENDSFSFNLDFKITEVPQLFTKITAIVK